MTQQTTNPTRPLEPQQRAIVIGASSGIGAALVHELAHAGYCVAALARREAKLETMSETINAVLEKTAVLPYTHSVTDYDDIPALFQKIVGDLGGLDLVIYNAGVLHQVGIDEYNFEKDRAMVEINTLGAIAWLNEAAHRFERAGKGHIVGIGSIAGDRGRVGSPVYNTSKAALHTYLESLRNRLAKKGVTVTTIKPGFVQTQMLEGASRTFWVISPEQAAEKIYKAIRRGAQVVYVPGQWRFVGLVIQHVPSFIFRRLSF